MVSSKCWAVVSPSPFRFLAALMPPCAHTECERFTGTMEKRSTWPPISAILITAASPASPPPTTMIFGVAAIAFRSPIFRAHAQQLVHQSHNRIGSRSGIDGLPRVVKERVHGSETSDHKDNRQREANIAKAAPRLLTHRDAPLRTEEPQAITKVP